MNGSIRRAAELIGAARHLVAFTGAGISTPSGIPDFRSPRSGLWENADPYEIASFDGFVRRPEAYYAWVRPLAKLIRDGRPNPAHAALAEMERRGILKAVITQNIDGLHQAAGSHVVLELHGSHREATCLRCLKIVPSRDYLDAFVASGQVPHCSCGGVLKPNTVLFGEMLPVAAWHQAELETKSCDVMLVAGTSLEVHPAAGLPALAKRRGARLVIVNRDRTPMDGQADVSIHDDVARTLPAIVDALPTDKAAPFPGAG